MRPTSGERRPELTESSQAARREEVCRGRSEREGRRRIGCEFRGVESESEMGRDGKKRDEERKTRLTFPFLTIARIKFPHVSGESKALGAFMFSS